MRAVLERRFRIQTQGPTRADLEAWEQDPCQWIDDWMWTSNPRERQPEIPLILWPRQRELVYQLTETYLERGTLAVTKPRYVGASWVMAAAVLWLCRREPGFEALIVSRTQSMVDVLGNMDTLFERFRFIAKRLPAESGLTMLTEDASRNRGAKLKPGDASKQALIAFANGSRLKGAWGKDPGRGGRVNLAVWDEVAAHPHQEAAWDSLQHVSDTLWAFSTYTAPGNLWFRWAADGGMPTFPMRWQDNPLLTEAWYEHAKRTSSNPVSFAREVECDPYASFAGALILPEWWDAAVKCVIPAGRPTAGYDPSGDGDCETVLVLRDGHKVLPLHPLKGSVRNRAAEAKRLSAGRTLHYDADGGWGETTRQALDGGRSVPIHGNGKTPPIDRVKQCKNLRSALYWSLARRFESTYQRMVEGPDSRITLDQCIQVPADTKLRQQLLSIRVMESPDGKILVQSKKDMPVSPDRADALAYTEYASLHPTSLGMSGGGRG